MQLLLEALMKKGVETETTDPSTIERILNNAYEVFPELKQQRVIGSWSGFALIALK